MCVCTFVSEQLCVSECVVPNLRCWGWGCPTPFTTDVSFHWCVHLCVCVCVRKALLHYFEDKARRKLQSNVHESKIPCAGNTA